MDPAEDLAAARVEYEAALGKKPFHGWDAAALRAKMANFIPPAFAADDPALLAPPPPPEAPKAEGVKVMLLCKGVFLPDDLLGADWASSQNTKRYDGETNDRRTKLTVHPTLAAFLQERKQAEILD